MDIKAKIELFPYFAYLFSKDANPEKYGSVKTAAEWTQLIQDDKEMADAAVAAAEQLSDEEWKDIQTQYLQINTENEIIEAAKGAKLEQLRASKTPSLTIISELLHQKQGGKMKSRKKCACGCELILGKAEGGKIIKTCACKCGGKVKKKK